MKRFTKGCLFTALALFILGCAFCGIFGTLGGFRQLDNLKIDNIVPGGLRWGYRNLFFNIWDGNDWWDDAFGKESLASSTKVQTGYRAEDITDIDIEVGGNNLVILESEDDSVWIENKSSVSGVKYGMKNGVFKLSYNARYRFFGLWGNSAEKGKIYLHLPKGMTLDTIDIEIGAGTFESIALKANEIDLDAGAGTFDIDGLQGDEIDISVGAGTANIGSITGTEVSIEAGAGEVIVEDMTAKNLDLEVAAGNLEIEGSLNGNADIECAAGSVYLKLLGEYTDYDYDVDCAVGDITVGGYKYSGIVSERSVDNGSGRIIDIECATGDIDIEFVQ